MASISMTLSSSQKARPLPRLSMRLGTAPVISASGIFTAVPMETTVAAWHLFRRRSISDFFGFDYWKACECTHDYNRSLYYEGSDQTPKYWPGYDAFSQTDDACAFIDRQLK